MLRVNKSYQLCAFECDRCCDLHFSAPVGTGARNPGERGTGKEGETGDKWGQGVPESSFSQLGTREKNRICKTTGNVRIRKLFNILRVWLGV